MSKSVDEMATTGHLTPMDDSDDLELEEEVPSRLTPVPVRGDHHTIWWYERREVAISYETAPYQLQFTTFEAASISRRMSFSGIIIGADVLPGDELTVDDDLFEALLVLFRNAAAQRAFVHDFYYALCVLYENQYEMDQMHPPKWMHAFGDQDIREATVEMLRRIGNARSSFGRYAILTTPPSGSNRDLVAVKAAMLDYKVYDLDNLVD